MAGSSPVGRGFLHQIADTDLSPLEDPEDRPALAAKGLLRAATQRVVEQLAGAATRTTSSRTSPILSRSPGVRGTSPCEIVRLRLVPPASMGRPKISAASASDSADCTLT